MEIEVCKRENGLFNYLFCKILKYMVKYELTLAHNPKMKVYLMKGMLYEFNNN